MGDKAIVKLMKQFMAFEKNSGEEEEEYDI